MSTFDGIVREFPSIQIDYFRKNPDRPAPLACFLSHVHSDHLQGLESFRAPFIYCSAATREILLRIEKYPHRMNFSKGLLEPRRLHYKHLSKLLRPIPLNTPTEIELTPQLSIRVTLLDANHCTGAVMFLIEGNGKAVLYTGDIRAEPWWINSLVRHPILIPYTLGTKRLDNVYLDNTFARPSHVWHTFPSKAEGLAELLQKIAPYPAGTTFYFRAWTFGYEEVWMALSAALNSKVHVDRYQIGLYKSLVSSRGASAVDAPPLCGFELGNRFVQGCLSEDEQSRIHSCEPGTRCSAVPSKKTVYILPIVNRTEDGSKVPEVGAGGGGGDLYRVHELELPDESALQQLDQLCLDRIQDPQTLAQTRQILSQAFISKTKALPLASYGIKDEQEIPLEDLINILTRDASHSHWLNNNQTTNLPTTIHFPYSRHSSYTELRALIAALKPHDITPCTVDPDHWTEEISMQALFGDLCSSTTFAHDAYMRASLTDDMDLDPRARKRARCEVEVETQTQETQKTCGEVGDTFSSAVGRGVGSADAVNAIPIPSSLETISDIPSTPNETLPIPKSNAETQKAKRNEIRNAWNILSKARSKEDIPSYDLGNLPSSWPTEEEDGFNAESRKDENNEVTNEGRRENQGQEPVSTIKRDESASQEINQSQSFSTDIEEPESQGGSQFSHALSLESSAFASQEQDNALEVDALPDEQVPSQVPPDETDPRPTLQRASSSRMRRAAYLAARADSYDAWAAMAPASAGNNHTEEEMEL